MNWTGVMKKGRLLQKELFTTSSYIRAGLHWHKSLACTELASQPHSSRWRWHDSLLTPPKSSAGSTCGKRSDQRIFIDTRWHSLASYMMIKDYNSRLTYCLPPTGPDGKVHRWEGETTLHVLTLNRIWPVIFLTYQLDLPAWQFVLPMTLKLRPESWPNFDVALVDAMLRVSPDAHWLMCRLGSPA